MEEEIILTDEENEPLLIPFEQGLLGVQTPDGNKTWAELEGQGVVSLHEGDATTLPVQVEVINGFLNIYVSRQ